MWQINHGDLGWRKCGERAITEKIKAPSWADRQPARHCTLLQLDLGVHSSQLIHLFHSSVSVKLSLFQWYRPTWIILWGSFVLSPIDPPVLLLQLGIVFTHAVCELVLLKEMLVTRYLKTSQQHTAYKYAALKYGKPVQIFAFLGFYP